MLPLLHTHSFNYMLFFQDKLEKPGSLPQSTDLLDIGQYWIVQYHLRSVPCARVWIKRNTWRATGPHDKLPCIWLCRIYLRTVFARFFSVSFKLDGN